MVAKLGGELNLQQALQSGDIVRVTELLDCFVFRVFSVCFKAKNKNLSQ